MLLETTIKSIALTFTLLNPSNYTPPTLDFSSPRQEYAFCHPYHQEKMREDILFLRLLNNERRTRIERAIEEYNENNIPETTKLLEEADKYAKQMHRYRADFYLHAREGNCLEENMPRDYFNSFMSAISSYLKDSVRALTLEGKMFFRF